MLMVLSLLLVVVAFRASKQKNNKAGKIFVTLLGVSAIVTMGHSVKLISDTYAGIDIGITPTSPSIRIEAGQERDFVSPEDLAVSLTIVVDSGSQCVFGFASDNCVPANLLPPGFVPGTPIVELGEERNSLPFTGTLNTNMLANDICLIRCIDPNAEEDLVVEFKPAARRTRRSRE